MRLFLWMFCRMTVGCLGADPDYGWYRVFSEGCDTGGYGGCDRAACAGDSGGDAGV